ncbi:uncharacterized protein EV420DRAFT_679902 [Desarmillaria tabescens]|uniref:RanBD1 domain-containing protein n=1 Tax=Armillaria tabescens TaxID=1929756 RepID=A0AA39K5N7_ARMTA|nr:uncharacterized protein EV420DRAFT_679902 [Desarmillaria tabescens]KAK0452713.1 hypothetical protein EV420DRAFT_679902 [Desarmillaria tabescens]
MLLFPISDIKVVVCGMATIAASVGYACTRRFSVQTPIMDRDSVPDSGQVEKSVEETPTDANSDDSARRTSLKRKQMHDHDENNNDLEYPHNLSAIYPNKRNRTPPISDADDEPGQGVSVDPDNQHLGMASTAVDTLNKDTAPEASDNPKESPRIEEATTTETSPGPTEVLTTDKAPLDVVEDTPTVALKTEATKPVLPQPKPKPRCSPIKSSGGFASYSGTASPFKTIKAGSSTTTPVWSHKNVSSTTDRVTIDRPLAAPTEAPRESTVPHLTGEEDEEVATDIKGVRLYIKRGERDFTSGMLGHVKLLSNKTSQNQRLLLRRDPLWQVTMNVRLTPAVKCIFDEEDLSLRVILAEAIEREDVPVEQWTREVVVYALKPGRSCSKQDFREFAVSLLASTSLKR